MSKSTGVLTREDIDDALMWCEERGGIVVMDHNDRPWILTEDDNGDRWAISTWYEEDESKPPFILERSPVAFPVRLMLPAAQVHL